MTILEPSSHPIPDSDGQFPRHIDECDSERLVEHSTGGRFVDVVALMFGVVAVAVVTDSFVEVRADTSPGDHLVSGVVPLAVLFAIGVLVRRVRIGTAAAITLLLGISVTVGGAAAPTAAVARNDVRPATLTGCIATVAGVVLLGLALRELWKARRHDGTRRRRWARRGTRIIVTALAALLVATPVGMGYAAANRSGPARVAGDLGAPHEDIALHTADGIRLTAAYVPSRNGAAVVVFPGIDGEHVTERSRMLVRHGYGVLVVEPRGNGESGGDPNLFGWSGGGDVTAAIDFLAARSDVVDGRIAGLGLSVGAEQLLEAAARDERLHAVVSEGAGTRWVAEDLHTPFPASVVQIPFATMATISTAIFSDSLPPPRIEDVIADIAPRPTLLIYATPGAGGEWFNPRYADRAGPTATSWEIPDSAHTDGYATDPRQYETRVIGFLDEALASGER